MNSFMEMDWGAKWDWENIVMYGSKGSEIPKKLRLNDWDIVEEGEMDGGSFNLSGVGYGNSSVRSGSDLVNGSSGKSSISASTDSSPKDGMSASNLAFEALKGSFGDISMRKESGRVVELARNSPPLEGSVGFMEPLIGLKLGKRTYFENSCSGGGNAKSPSSVISAPSTTAVKKTKSVSPGVPTPRCQVEGCNLDLSSAKEYHRKHRVCDSHSKCPKVVVGGLERRFCQQCSRFHGLSEFDEKKRSCRRRLSDHNARRRKPQQESIQFNSARLPSFYDGRQQMNFMVNDASLVHTSNAAISDWESTYNSKFTVTREFSTKSDRAGGQHGQQQMTVNQLPHVNSMHSSVSNRFLALKGVTSQVFSEGLKELIHSSTVDAAPEFRRALSLLSTNSSGSYKPESASLGDPVSVSHSNIVSQTAMHAIPQGLPMASAEYWPTGQQQPTYPRVHALASENDGIAHLEGIQVLRTSYAENMYHNPLN